MKNLNIKVPASEIDRMDEIVESKGYPSRSEFIREAIRDKIDEEMRIHPKVLERVIEGRKESSEDRKTVEEVMDEHLSDDDELNESRA